MARTGNSPERRAQIVDGLVRAMARQRGYDGATVARIAHEAGLTSGLVHYHFRSKQEILIALAERLASGARARLERRLDRAAASPRARLMAAIDALLETGEEADPSGVACWALLAAESVRQLEVRAVYERWITQTTALLRRLFTDILHAEGRSRAGVAAMAAGLIALVEGFYGLAAGAPGAIPPGSAAAVARRMATGLLDSQPREAP